MPHPRAHYCLPALVLGVALLVTSCGASTSGATAQATATSQSTATPTASPAPTLQPVTVLLPPNCKPVVPGTFPTGTYVASDIARTYEYLPNGEVHHHQSEEICYLVEQQQLLFFDPRKCNDTATQYGDYSWTFDGTNLRLKVLQDSCLIRADDLVGQSRYWTKVNA